MKKNAFLIVSLQSILLSTVYCLRADAAGGIPLELQQAIEVKNKALQEVTNQLQATHDSLIETEAQSKSLKQELGKINYLVNQLNLGIKSSEISIDKLELEISSLQYEILDAEEKSEATKAAIRQLLRRLYAQDGEHILVTLIKHKTLAESIAAIEGAQTVNKTLAKESKALSETREILAEKLDAQQKRKGALEVERRTLAARKSSAEEQKADRQTLLVQTKNQERLYQQTIKELEEKQQDISEEIEEIERQLREKIDPSLLPQKRPGVLLTPTKGVLSQNFGATKFALRGGYRGKFHNGADIAAPIGTPIYAAEDGKVRKIENQDRFCRKGAYGKYIAIEHENNLATLYAHLSAWNTNIKEGQVVKRGDVIGYVGKTGYATGPHLHFTVYSKPTFYIGNSRSCGPMPYGGVLNPLDYL